jgi:hypothetical protein
MGHSKTSPARLAVVEKQCQALELRKAGRTYAAIAQELGYCSPSGAEKAVRVAIRKILAEPGEEVIAMERERLDALLGAVWEQALAGDFQAVDRALKIMERRARLLGLDRPLKIEARADVAAKTENKWNLDALSTEELEMLVLMGAKAAPGRITAGNGGGEAG